LVVSGKYKCRFSVNKKAGVSASLISDLQRNKILKNSIFEDYFSVFQPERFTGLFNYFSFKKQPIQDCCCKNFTIKHINTSSGPFWVVITIDIFWFR